MFVANPEDEEKDVQHCSLREKLENELKELDKILEQKERVAGGDTFVLKQHYEKKVQDLENEKRALQAVELKKKQDAQAQLLRQKLKSDEAAKNLQDETLHFSGNFF
ncbi:hypothetical protein L2E82_00618 [Cichorium intybus]|uniref:Uncharacterized protein n=1 Tax=Cichorium intybus TaxID=13427 RepID=A0ACB9GXV4_CICIN|nr:hypothetical protein L2E82_00618 [Cichorium intybus]